MAFFVSRAAELRLVVVPQRTVVHNLRDGSSEREVIRGRALQFSPIGAAVHVGGLKHTGMGELQQPVHHPRVGNVPARGHLSMHVALKQVNSGFPEELHWDETDLLEAVVKRSGYQRSFDIVYEDHPSATKGQHGGDRRSVEDLVVTEAQKREAQAERDALYETNGVEGTDDPKKVKCKPCDRVISVQGLTAHLRSKGHRDSLEGYWADVKGE